MAVAPLQGHVAAELGAGAVGAAVGTEALEIRQHPRRPTHPLGPAGGDGELVIEEGGVVGAGDIADEAAGGAFRSDHLHLVPAQMGQQRLDPVGVVASGELTKLGQGIGLPPRSRLLIG